MYPTALAEALRAAGIDARSASEAGLVGRPDADIFAAAVADGLTLLTENVSDFPRIAADHVNAGGHHHGVLVAISSRFSRRPQVVFRWSGPSSGSLRMTCQTRSSTSGVPRLGDEWVPDVFEAGWPAAANTARCQPG